ncbi:MAG: VOC family protein [Ardenticatenaceae bacterium]|nr:VOC family protein [Ardenticatenaceae bacterium]MCB9445064.1 VOC family protein [Ardenticatenaceae bacterium]
MQVVKSYPDGVFCWVDLMTTDLDGAKAFYNGLFGWEFDDRPIDMGGVYAMAQIASKNVAGLSGMDPNMQAQGMPPVWSSYVKHSDADAVAAKVAAAGGTLMMPPMDVMEEGRMMMFMDPSGAAVGVWQPKNHIGAELVNTPNALVWNELQTRDSAAAKAFFEKVLDWTIDADSNGYLLCKANGRTQAGIMQMDENWGDVPNNWAVYFMVEDLEASVAKVKELSGSIIVPPTSAGEMGKFAVIQDPQGGIFTIMQFSGPVDPPPGY